MTATFERLKEKARQVVALVQLRSPDDAILVVLEALLEVRREGRTELMDEIENAILPLLVDEADKVRAETPKRVQ